MPPHDVKANAAFDLDAVRTIELPRHARSEGEVVVAEGDRSVPFAIARMFTVKAPSGAKRGEHAHRRCSQFMICVHGVIDIGCDDGRSQRIFALDRSNLALMVPPTIWNTVMFRHSDSVLAVLCDRGYEEHDYIRDYAEFLAFRGAVHA
ncbi:MAG: FdtA/QdtA family cupin domain-containing protein [Xanthobacteraceae bacterium]